MYAISNFLIVIIINCIKKLLFKKFVEFVSKYVKTFIYLPFAISPNSINQKKALQYEIITKFLKRQSVQRLMLIVYFYNLNNIFDLDIFFD